MMKIKKVLSIILSNCLTNMKDYESELMCQITCLTDPKGIWEFYFVRITPNVK